MKSISIGKKFIILAIFSIIAIISIGLYGLYNIRATFAWVGNVYNTAQDIQHIAFEMGEPLNKVHQLSLLIVTVPHQKMQLDLYEQQKKLIKQIDDTIKVWHDHVMTAKEQNRVTQVEQAWQQYKKLSSYTTETLLEGYREAAFMNASGAERQQFDVLLDVFHQWVTEYTKTAQQIQENANATYYSTLTVSLVALVVLVLLVAVFNFYTAKLIIRPLNKAVAIANAVANGNLNNEIIVLNHDESGQLLQALERMQTQLRGKIAEEKRITEEALRINQALDSVTTSVLIADNNYKIIYMNNALKTLFQQEAEKLRRELPLFDPDKLLYEPVDILHKNPQAHRNLLKNLKATEKAKLDLDSLVIEYMLTPVINGNGERLGFVKEFNNRTQEFATEQEINQVIHTASQGNFTQRIRLTDKAGFFKTVSESLNQIMDLNQQVIKDTMRMFAALAKGDLTQTINTLYVGEFAQLKMDANATVCKLTEVMGLIQKSANMVDSVAESLLQGNTSLSQRTEEQAAALEETAASIEEMTSIVQQNAENARQANELAMNARKDAQEGGDVVNATIAAMVNINTSSKRVTDIIGVINDIAFQTNLLALNAAVEAARAGEQGRGFAVVAAEVRNLAQRSAEAAKEIKTLIEDSVNKVNEGSVLVNQSGATLQRIFLAVKKVSDIIAEITAASQEQAAGIHQVNKAISQMDEMTQQNSNMVSQAKEASEIMREQASQLMKHTAFFRLSTTELPSPTHNTTVEQVTKPVKKINTPSVKQVHYQHLENLHAQQNAKKASKLASSTYSSPTRAKVKKEDDWEDF
ncbi:methyl-accepting chemotaxis protein [Beggiatoa leptomitoformis]|uniref:HAMP domain-containing protein n=1 Tax=Beggiatoa leptomitoformis TaxID=288004 RepID=A0A2N9YBA7_9GAMM|nr:methyl-accepting chemotaxis protein [Beggiatoa leptomitoformis]AUI67757.1 HAMP domain-containing protein [Beggiatoa leptomitoformis]QGX03509.1 HAMP domain-containing protein [Beggiatoa leptomitoformis]